MKQEKIGTFIATLRKNKGLTQEDLASKLGISPKTISKWETGLNLPEVSLLPQIAEIFNISIDDIFSCNYKNTKIKRRLKKVVLIIFIVIFIMSILIFVSYKFYSNLYKYQVYKLESLNGEYLIDGYFTKNIDNNMLLINHLTSNQAIIDENIKISYIEFKITSNAQFIQSEAYTFDEEESLSKILEQTRLFIYTDRKGEFKKDIDVDDVILHLTYVQNGETNIKLIKINLIPYKSN